jgi:hypothetical protein
MSPVMKLSGAHETSRPWRIHIPPARIRTQPRAVRIAAKGYRRPLPSLPMSERLEKWMDDYVLAWSTNQADDIAALFTTDAVYDPQTPEGEWDGIDEIIRRWQERDQDEENWEFEWRPLVETDAVAIVTGRTRYVDPPVSYRNLFVIMFDDQGRCHDFTEWWIEEEG